jgi:putative transposase
LTLDRVSRVGHALGMPRKVRVEYAGACYHVINRGNYRRDLFTGKGAAESFESCLFEACTGFGWRLHAFVIMSNHFHLAVETPEPNLSDGMKWLQGTWAARFNRFRGEAGRPFQGRYKALHVERGHALAQVVHYIHLNPLRARVVTPEKLTTYRWSSLPLFIGRKRPAFLEPSLVLGESGPLADTAAGWRKYVEYLLLLQEQEPVKRAERFGRYSRGWAIGSDAFKAQLNQELTRDVGSAGPFRLLGADREAHREQRAALWEEKLMLAAKTLEVDLHALPAQKSAESKVVLAALMRAGTSASNCWLAERLGMGLPASVSQYVRRFRLRGGWETKRFRGALQRLLADR